MAYQSKKHRKFVATSVTAALVATAVAPAAGFAAEATKDFSDVANHWAKKHIDYLVGIGAVNGYEDGTFKPNANLTRAEAAAILARVLDLNVDNNVEAPFGDLEGHWAAGVVAALKAYNEDIISGYEDGTFKPNANITRQELAKIVVTAFGLQLNEDADVSFDDNTGWGKKEIEILASLGIVQGKSAGKFEPNALVTRGEAAAFVHRTEVPAERVAVPKKPVTTLEVVSVSATNLKEVVVEFNQDLTDNSEAAKTGNYTLKSGDDELKLSQVIVEENVVRLVLADSAKQQQKATLSISAKVLPEKEEHEVEFFDTAIPTADFAEVIGINAVKVTFSEPITNAEGNSLKDGFKLVNADGTSYNIDEVTLQNGGKEARITFYSDFEEGKYELSVTNKLQDYAGYSVTPKTFDLYVELDEEAPSVVGYQNASAYEVTLIYNEDVAFNDERALIVYHSDFYDADDFKDEDKLVANNDDLVEKFYHTNASNHASKVEIDGNKVILTFPSKHKLPEKTANLYVGGESLKDLWNNVQKSTERIVVEVQADETAPTVTEVKQVSNEQRKFTVKFSEKVKKSTAEKLENYKLLDSEGKEVKLDKAELSDDATTVTITASKDLVGTFKLITSGIEDLAGNKSANKEVEFTMKNVAPLSIKNFTGKFYQEKEDGNVIIRIDFNRPMKTSGANSVTDLSKYQIAGVVLDDVKDATIKAVDGNKGVEIVFNSKEFAKAGGADNYFNKTKEDVTVTLSRVEDADGNKSEFSETFTISNGINNPIRATVEAVSKDELVVKFDSEITNFDHKEFEVGYYVDGEFKELKVRSASKVDSKTVKLFLAKDSELNSDATYSDNKYEVVVRTVEKVKNTRNQYGAKVELEDVKLKDKIAPAIKKNADGKYYEVNERTIKITFTEAINLSVSDLVAATDLTVTDEDGDKWVVGTDFTIAVDDKDSSVLVITIKDSVKYTGDLTIKVKDAEYIVDAKGGNAIKDFDIKVQGVDVDTVNDEDEDEGEE